MKLLPSACIILDVEQGGREACEGRKETPAGIRFLFLQSIAGMSGNASNFKEDGNKEDEHV